MGQWFLDWYSSKLPVCELLLVHNEIRKLYQNVNQCIVLLLLQESFAMKNIISAELTVYLVTYLIYIFVLSGVFDPGIVLSQQGEVTVCGRHQSADHNLCSAHLHPSLHTSCGLHFHLIPLHHFS